MEQKEAINYINLDNRFKDLNCIEPSTFCFLPENIEDAKSMDEFIYTDNALVLRKLFKANNLPEERLHDNISKTRQRRSADWYGPTLFIGYSLWTQNPNMVSIGLSVIANYVTDFFKGSFGEKKIKLEIVIETTPKKIYKKLTYEGDAQGLKNIEDLIKKMTK
ncbi:hypothetical protein CJD36_021385 [Flavipsychrobacter stenotrophus]|uniref:Uncharacterized protein n=1 Tax=Flavipsychrobacter stenotrophus TaxID=2077091 RepID=A0A2S7SQS9_9BACT|nr:hypothetical protein [Flavipsychrobacter stenotrophus]PQJ08965.1 hypothetical protein CJD36_021385 [Flavipsychrobacter stenotrophus]